MKHSMKEGTSMNPRTIKVLLTTLGEDKDILQFCLDKDTYINIDLDSTACQTEIKKLFSEILRIAVDEEVELEFVSEEGFPRDLYKDVCEQYILDIARELRTSNIAIKREIG